MPKATLLVLAVLFVAEAAVRYRYAMDSSHFGHSFVGMMHAYEDTLADQSVDTWCIGNSTLAAGFEETSYEQGTEESCIKIAHGSSNAAGYAALLDHYLGQSSAPRRVIIFLAKDDLNRNGLRADLSRQYIDYVSESPLRPSHWLMLHYDRQELRQAALDQVDRAYSALRNQPTAESLRFKPQGLDQKMYQHEQDFEEISNLREAVRDWQYDHEGLQSIFDAAARHGVQDICVVMLPCTDILARYHDRKIPEMTYTQLRASVRQQCEAAGVSCLDLALATDRHELFFDSFHPNAWGRQIVTAIVSEWVSQGTPSRSPLTETELEEWIARLLSDDASFAMRRSEWLADTGHKEFKLSATPSD